MEQSVTLFTKQNKLKTVLVSVGFANLMAHTFYCRKFLTLSWRRSLLYRNQFINFYSNQGTGFYITRTSVMKELKTAYKKFSAKIELTYRVSHSCRKLKCKMSSFSNQASPLVSKIKNYIIIKSSTSHIREPVRYSIFIYKSYKNHSQVFFKVDFLKNFAIYTGKHISWHLFLMKLQT